MWPYLHALAFTRRKIVMVLCFAICGLLLAVSVTSNLFWFLSHEAAQTVLILSGFFTGLAAVSIPLLVGFAVSPTVMVRHLSSETLRKTFHEAIEKYAESLNKKLADGNPGKDQSRILLRELTKAFTMCSPAELQTIVRKHVSSAAVSYTADYAWFSGKKKEGVLTLSYADPRKPSEPIVQKQVFWQSS